MEYNTNHAEVNLNYINSKEFVDNKEKNSYNWINNENINLDEFNMTTENIEQKESFLSAEQFEMVIKALQLVNANVKKDDVLKNIVDVAVNLTNADRGTLYLVDKETNEIWSKVLIGGEVSEIRLKIGDGLSGWVQKPAKLLILKM